MKECSVVKYSLEMHMASPLRDSQCKKISLLKAMRGPASCKKERLAFGERSW